MKVTRGHFNRKVLFFGLLLFLAISLISTGFASWIMSTGAEEGENGNVHVGTVTDGSLEFGKIEFANNNSEIIFDASEDDKSGDIKADLIEKKFENLSITLTTTLTPVEYVKSLSIAIAVPETVKDAYEQGYITMPKCCYSKGTTATPVVVFADGMIKDLADTGIEVTMTDSDSDGTYEISVTLTFGWGTQFGGKNPGIYLDEFVDGDGKAMSYADKLAKMIAFKRTIYGLAIPVDSEHVQEGEATDEQVLGFVSKPLAFDILLSAVAN